MKFFKSNAKSLRTRYVIQGGYIVAVNICSVQCINAGKKIEIKSGSSRIFDKEKFTMVERIDSN